MKAHAGVQEGRKGKTDKTFGLDRRQAVEIGAQHVALEHEVGELALAHDLDQAGRLQFLEVVRDSGRADPHALVQRAARHRAVAGADPFEHLIAARLRQRTRDALELLVGEGGLLRGWHEGKVGCYVAKSNRQDGRSTRRINEGPAWRSGIKVTE